MSAHRKALPIKGGHCLSAASRSLAYAPYSDLVDGDINPDLEQCRRFGMRKSPAYNCSLSFNWSANLDKDDIARFL